MKAPGSCQLKLSKCDSDNPGQCRGADGCRKPSVVFWSGVGWHSGGRRALKIHPRGWAAPLWAEVPVILSGGTAALPFLSLHGKSSTFVSSVLKCHGEWLNEISAIEVCILSFFLWQRHLKSLTSL